jgi:hypothetical protein
MSSPYSAPIVMVGVGVAKPAPSKAGVTVPGVPPPATVPPAALRTIDLAVSSPAIIFEKK